MSEQQRILEMIEKGQITATEGMELLDALKGVKAEAPTEVEVVRTTQTKNYKFLRIKVIAENGVLGVKDAVKAFLAGQLPLSDAANVEGQW